MKKLIFYISNSIISTIFLSVRFLSYLLEHELASMTVYEFSEGQIFFNNFIVVFFTAFLLFNIYMAYKETKRID